MGWRHQRWKIHNTSEGVYTTGFEVTPFFSKKQKLKLFLSLNEWRYGTHATLTGLTIK